MTLLKRIYNPITIEKDNPQLRDFKGPVTSKLEWKYIEHNKVDRNELQIRKNLGHFCSCAFMQSLANVEFIPVNFIVFKVPSVQF